MIAAIPETSYGVAKRLAFAVDILDRTRPQTVLDVGCGTGTLLTAPLAARFPNALFHGVDPDPETLNLARELHDLPNLTFTTSDALAPDARFDLVIASEVLEHVEDPLAFLAFLRLRLNPGGQVLLTVPNGHGPFEWGNSLEVVLQLSGAYRLLRKLKHRVVGRSYSEALAPDATNTLAVSPHINFFSYRALTRTLAEAGLAATDYRGRTFLCGFIWGRWVITTERAMRWNAAVADSLPPQAVSDWMFVLAPGFEPSRTAGYRRGASEALRRRLYERRWGITH